MADERMPPEERRRREEGRFHQEGERPEARPSHESGDEDAHRSLRPETGESPPQTADRPTRERERVRHLEREEQRQGRHDPPPREDTRAPTAPAGEETRSPDDPGERRVGHEHVPGDRFRFERFESGRSRFVSAVFDKAEDAERAAQYLTERGVPNEELIVFLSKEAGDEYVSARQMYEDHEGHTYISKRKVPLKEKSKALEGTGAGAAIGGGLGAIAAAIAAAGTSIAIPPLGIIVAGPVFAAFAGAGAGGLAGGLIGALVGAGMSEYRAKEIDKRLRKGGVVLGVNARDEAQVPQLEEALARHGAEVVRETQETG